MGCPDCESGLVETNDEASPAEQAGWSDFYKGKDDNPYPKKSTAAQDWKFGWDRAWRHENGEDY